MRISKIVMKNDFFHISPNIPFHPLLVCFVIIRSSGPPLPQKGKGSARGPRIKALGRRGKRYGVKLSAPHANLTLVIRLDADAGYSVTAVAPTSADDDRSALCHSKLACDGPAPHRPSRAQQRRIRLDAESLSRDYALTSDTCSSSASTACRRLASLLLLLTSAGAAKVIVFSAVT